MVLGAGGWYYYAHYYQSKPPGPMEASTNPSNGSLFDHKPGEKVGDWTLESITGTSLKDIVITFSGNVILRGGPHTRSEPKAEYFSISYEDTDKLPHFPEDPRDYFPRGIRLDNGEVLLRKAQEEGVQIGVDPEGNDRMVTIRVVKFVTKADPYATGGLEDHITFSEFVR